MEERRERGKVPLFLPEGGVRNPSPNLRNTSEGTSQSPSPTFSPRLLRLFPSLLLFGPLMFPSSSPTNSCTVPWVLDPRTPTHPTSDVPSPTTLLRHESSSTFFYQTGGCPRSPWSPLRPESLPSHPRRYGSKTGSSVVHK